MKLRIERVIKNAELTVGVMSIDDVPTCFTVEDIEREVKVKGKTAIPTGIYEVGLQLAETNLTKTYRSKFSWFKHHLMLKNVPNFESVYLHIGNFAEDTDGCILVGTTYSFSKPNMIKNSTLMYKYIYKKLYREAANNNLVIEIIG